jgi:hypothetical protein
MRQLRRRDLEDGPCGQDPRREESHRRVAAHRPGERQREQGERRPGPEGDPHRQKVVSGRAGMPFGGAVDLPEEIAAERLGVERPVGGEADGDEPRQGQAGEEQEARPRLRPPQRIDGERGRRQPQERPARHHQDDRALDQDTSRERGPEQGVRPAEAILGGPGERADERALRKDHEGEEGGVRLGDVAFRRRDGRGGDDEARQGRGRRPDEWAHRPDGQEGRGEDAEGGGQPPDPDRCLDPLARGGGGGRLEPVDARRLLPARRVEVARLDEVAAREHLLGRDDIPRLVPVGEGKRRLSGNEVEGGDEDDEQDRQHGAPPQSGEEPPGAGVQPAEEPDHAIRARAGARDRRLSAEGGPRPAGGPGRAGCAPVLRSPAGRGPRCRPSSARRRSSA